MNGFEVPAAFAEATDRQSSVHGIIARALTSLAAKIKPVPQEFDRGPAILSEGEPPVIVVPDGIAEKYLKSLDLKQFRH